MYPKLASELNNTRGFLVGTCKLLDIEPTNVDVSILDKHVRCCDNCGTWQVPSKMTEEPDGTIYCSNCIGAEQMRF